MLQMTVRASSASICCYRFPQPCHVGIQSKSWSAWNCMVSCSSAFRAPSPPCYVPSHCRVVGLHDLELRREVHPHFFARLWLHRRAGAQGSSLEHVAAGLQPNVSARTWDHVPESRHDVTFMAQGHLCISFEGLAKDQDARQNRAEFTLEKKHRLCNTEHHRCGSQTSQTNSRSPCSNQDKQPAHKYPTRSSCADRYYQFKWEGGEQDRKSGRRSRRQEHRERERKLVLSKIVARHVCAKATVRLVA